MCITFLSCICAAIFGNTGYTGKGTDYGASSVAAYTKSNHGPDGSLFLDPYFRKDLENLQGKKILDAGCGAAPWSIYAAGHGGKVYSIDLQESMIQSATKAIQEAGLSHQIELTQGDVADLPYEKDFFDKAISICVGCNLPKESFDKHFTEINRTLQPGGIAVIGAPSSLGTVFTDGSASTEEASKHIYQVLKETPENPTGEVVRTKLLELKEVLSATFFLEKGKLTLLTDSHNLLPGTQIWRKLPTLVIPNYYYSSKDYEKALHKHGFQIAHTDLPSFSNEEERVLHNTTHPNTTLGPAYTHRNPFIIFHAKKTTQ